MRQTQSQAEARAAARKRRSVDVEVHISSYEMATVYLDRIDIEDLRAELRDRELNGDRVNEQGDLEDGFGVFTLNLRELETIRHLYLTGREVEASSRCRRMLADMLGTAI